MSSNFLIDIPGGSKVYFRPVGAIGPVQGNASNSALLSPTGLRFVGGIVYHRKDRHYVSSEYISLDVLRSQLDDCSEDVRSQLKRQLEMLERPLSPIKVRGELNRSFSKPLLMGVLNVTPDSFSDGGRFNDTNAAIRRGRQMISEGANIIDVGGESTRPGAKPVWEGDEAARVIPVIEGLAREGALISIDTRRASVMEKAIQAGAHIINDVSALSHDPESLNVAARSGLPVVLMHAQGDPQTMQDNPEYHHVLLDIYDYLAQRVYACVQAGIGPDKIIIDPGIGFGKRVVSDNVTLLNGLSLFLTLGCPLLLGASRKRFIGAITGIDDADRRVIGSVTAALKGMQEGASIIRAHDVRETAEAMKMMQAFRDGESMDGMSFTR